MRIYSNGRTSTFTVFIAKAVRARKREIQPYNAIRTIYCSNRRACVPLRMHIIIVADGQITTKTRQAAYKHTHTLTTRSYSRCMCAIRWGLCATRTSTRGFKKFSLLTALFAFKLNWKSALFEWIATIELLMDFVYAVRQSDWRGKNIQVFCAKFMGWKFRGDLKSAVGLSSKFKCFECQCERKKSKETKSFAKWWRWRKAKWSEERIRLTKVTTVIRKHAIR